MQTDHLFKRQCLDRFVGNVWCLIDTYVITNITSVLPLILDQEMLTFNCTSFNKSLLLSHVMYINISQTPQEFRHSFSSSSVHDRVSLRSSMSYFMVIIVQNYRINYYLLNQHLVRGYAIDIKYARINYFTCLYLYWKCYNN